MSNIIASIYVDTFVYENDISKFVENQLDYAPTISGGEVDASVFVNALEVYNHVPINCADCDYNDYIVTDQESELYCRKPWDYNCQKKAYQTCVAITIVGNLRDRKRDETLEEYDAFLNYLGDTLGYDIKNHSYSIT